MREPGGSLDDDIEVEGKRFFDDWGDERLQSSISALRTMQSSNGFQVFGYAINEMRQDAFLRFPSMRQTDEIFRLQGGLLAMENVNNLVEDTIEAMSKLMQDRKERRSLSEAAARRQSLSDNR